MKKELRIKFPRGYFVKFLRRYNVGPYSDHQYPKRIKKGYTTEPRSPIIMCNNGWHAAQISRQGIGNWRDYSCYVVKSNGRHISDRYEYKVCCQSITFIGKVPKISKRLKYHEEVMKQADKIIKAWRKLNERKSNNRRKRKLQAKKQAKA